MKKVIDKIIFDAEVSERKILRIPISTIATTPYNPSERTKEGKELSRLVKAVKKYGVIQPIIITADRDLVDGNRRLAASKFAGHSHIDCIILDDCVDRDEVFGDLNSTSKKMTNRGWLYACRNGIKTPPKDIGTQYQELLKLVGVYGVNLLIEKKLGLSLLSLCKSVKAQGVTMRLDEIIMRVARGRLTNSLNMAMRSKSMTQEQKAKVLSDFLGDVME